LEFVGPATWAALSGEPVSHDVLADPELVNHVRLAREADLVLVAPATADLLARAATGRADDLLTATLLTTRAPVIYAPAMHTEMWQHPATRANVELLRERGAIVVDPAVGRLTGSDSGAGRLPDPEELAALARVVLARPAGTLDLAGRHVVISAGGTREYLDPVRFLGNRSSGRQGYALARTALARGAQVCLVAANVELADPAGAKLIRVGSATELRDAVTEAAAGADAVVMAAAVADWGPAEVSPLKMKKAAEGDPPPLPLRRNPDVLTELVARRHPGQVVVGFAAETHDMLAAGREKLARKGVQLLVVNEVGDGRGFESPDNAAVILGDDGSAVEVPLGPKEALGHAVWDAVVARLVGGHG
jgi:phosphopantothenoylcysteine decarboxylase/phosphopantothenate--cysteine ligase